MANIENSKIPVFFILGRLRSGTSLLRTLFDAHPNVMIPPEYPQFFYLYARYKDKKQWSQAEIRDFFLELRHKKISQFNTSKMNL